MENLKSESKTQTDLIILHFSLIPFKESQFTIDKLFILSYSIVNERSLINSMKQHQLYLFNVMNS